MFVAIVFILIFFILYLQLKKVGTTANCIARLLMFHLNICKTSGERFMNVPPPPTPNPPEPGEWMLARPEPSEAAD